MRGAPYTISICVDCMLLIANGEVTDHNGKDISDRIGVMITALHGNRPITLGCLPEHCGDTPPCDPENVEEWFSRAACEGCGRREGGDRTHATVWEPEPMPDPSDIPAVEAWLA